MASNPISLAQTRIAQAARRGDYDGEVAARGQLQYLKLRRQIEESTFLTPEHRRALMEQIDPDGVI